MSTESFAQVSSYVEVKWIYWTLHQSSLATSLFHSHISLEAGGITQVGCPLWMLMPLNWLVSLSGATLHYLLPHQTKHPQVSSISMFLWVCPCKVHVTRWTMHYYHQSTCLAKACASNFVSPPVCKQYTESYVRTPIIIQKL